MNVQVPKSPIAGLSLALPDAHNVVEQFPVWQLPYGNTFQRLKVSSFIIQSESNSSISYDRALSMFKFGNSFVESGPEVKGPNMEFMIKSAETDNSYNVSIRLSVQLSKFLVFCVWMCVDI